MPIGVAYTKRVNPVTGEREEIGYSGKPRVVSEGGGKGITPGPVVKANEMAGAAPAGGSAIEAANVAAQMEQIERQFEGVRTSGYRPEELVWNGPGFASLGHMKGTGAQVIRNPVTGGQMILPPGQTPAMVLRGANQLARAKAEAQANVLRGQESDRAFARAMEQAFGIPEGVLAGMRPEQARVVGSEMQERQRFEYAQGEREQAQADEKRGIMSFAQSMGGVDQDAARASATMPTMHSAQDVFGMLQKANAAAEAEKKGGALEQVIGELDLLDPEEAGRTALQRIMATGAFKAGSVEANRVANVYAQRAQDAAKQKQLDAKADADFEKAEGKRVEGEAKAKKKAAEDEHSSIMAKVMPALTKALEIRGSEAAKGVSDEDVKRARLTGGAVPNRMAEKRAARQSAILMARMALGRSMDRGRFDELVKQAEMATETGDLVDVDAARSGKKPEDEDREIDAFIEALSGLISDELWSRLGG